jgi:hypothetical protein
MHGRYKPFDLKDYILSVQTRRPEAKAVRGRFEQARWPRFAMNAQSGRNA